MTDTDDEHALAPAPDVASDEGQRSDLPVNAHTFGMILLLASLSVLFAAALLAYIILRLRPNMAAIHLPVGLWASSITMLISSAALHYAVISARARRPRGMRRGLVATLILGVVFLCLQLPSLITLAQSHGKFVHIDETHRQLTPQDQSSVYALVVILIVLHGLHVVGGLVPMVITTSAALKGRYDDGRDRPVRLLAMYWHFLAVVWLLMISTFMLLR